jgi:hypothetical protein
MMQPSTPTLCALAAVAFVVACVAHEAVGHGGACLATGGTIVVLSSSLFRCAPPRVLVDAAGPLASLVTAAAAASVARAGGDGLRRTFFALLLAIAGFWAAGGLVSSAATDTDDLAFVLRSLPLRPYALWRVVMGAAGAALYVAVLRRVGRDLPAGRPLAAAYLTAGAVACISTVFYRGDLLPALREAALESLGASAGLLYLAFRPDDLGRAPASRASVPCNRPVIVLSVPVILLFWFALGRGIVHG